MAVFDFFNDMIDRLRIRFDGQASSVLIGITALMVLSGGVWTAKHAGQDVDRRMRRDLVNQASGVAATINPSNVRALSFTANDSSRSEFQRLRDQLRAYAEVAKISSLYTMALKNGQIVFGPESLPEGSPQSSPPGTVYQNPSQKDFEIFETGSRQIQGPHSDEYGTFVTATAPVFDPRTGEVLATVGIDVDAAVWQSAIRRAQWIPAAVTLVLLFILFLCWLTLKYRRCRSPYRLDRKRHAEIILCAVFLSLLTLLLAICADHNEREMRRESFHQLARTHAAVCAQQYYDLRSRIDQLVYFFQSSQEVTRDEFERYCEKLIQMGILQACSWLPAVPESETGSFVQAVRTAGLPDFSIWQKNKEGLNEPVSGRPVYYPALYITPLAEHRAGLGYDLNSEPARRTAIQEALRTKLPTATDPVKLIALSNSPLGIFIFAPVNAAVQKGVVAFVIRPENLLGGAQRYGKRGVELDVCMLQLRQGNEPLFVAGSSGQCGVRCFDELKTDLGVTFPVFRFGKAYVLRLIPDQNWLNGHALRQGLLVGLIGIMVTILVCLIVAQIINRRVNLEKKIEQRTGELLQREADLTAIIENQPGLVWLKDTESRFLAVNEAFATACGRRVPAEVAGKTDMDVWPDELAEKYRRDDRAVMENREHVMIEEQVCDRGEMRWFETFKTPVFSVSGEVVGTTGYSRDITERRQAEEMIRASRELTERIINTIEVRVFWKDKNLVYLGCNEAFARDAGFTSSADVIGKDDYQMGWRDQAESYRRDDRAVVGSGACKLQIEESQTAPDGRILTLLTNKVPLRDSAGEICGILGTYIDITERKLVEEALRASEAEFRTLAEAMPQIVWAARPDGWNIYFNQQWVDYTGMTLEESYGHGWNIPFHPDDRQVAWNAWQDATQNDKPYELECRLRRADGAYYWWLIRGAPLRDASGKIIKWFGTCTNIESLKQAEEELQEKYKELERFNKVTVGREIRMIELKQEINALLKAAGQPKKYKIVTEG